MNELLMKGDGPEVKLMSKSSKGRLMFNVNKFYYLLTILFGLQWDIRNLRSEFTVVYSTVMLLQQP